MLHHEQKYRKNAILYDMLQFCVQGMFFFLQPSGWKLLLVLAHKKEKHFNMLLWFVTLLLLYAWSLFFPESQ